MANPQRLRYRGMDLREELVTPQMAHAYLAKNVGNRKLQKSAVARYASDMEAGNWEDKPIAICFDENGQLGNGQHTLHAITASGKPQYLLIAENVRRRAIAMMDVGQKRTINDIAHFVGEDFNSPRAAVVRIMVAGSPQSAGRARDTFSQLLEAHQFYQEAIDFAFAAGGRAKHKGINAVTQSVAAMAWYTKDRDRIAEFMDCLRTGNIKSADDMAAIRLREVILKPSNGCGTSIRQDQFRKTVSALEHFLNRKGASKLYGRDADIFPYPKMEA